jgi:hypothetical protein
VAHDDVPLLGRIARLTGKTPLALVPVARGYTRARRLIVRFADGSSVFAKLATDANTANWLHAEHRIYARLAGHARFLPALIGWDPGDDDATALPLLLLEDLSAATWPPPWTARRVDVVLAALADVRAALPLLADLHLRRFEDDRAEMASWSRVAADPGPFLSLGLCDTAWLERALPDLLAAEASALLDGGDLLHLDVRSDNLCFREDGAAVLVDWNWASHGNGLADLAGWAPSLHAEGGPPPEMILPDQPALAALLAGYWAWRAGKPAPAPGSRVRDVQRTQLSTALPWAARALGLTPPM